MSNYKTINPILKWAGGKKTLIPELRKFFPAEYNRYFEPFVGGGAVFFNLGHSESHISDTNSHLINFYQQVALNLQEFISRARTLEARFNLNFENREPLFYEVRERFNSGNNSNLEQAVDFLFLNKTAFNGIYRENRAGLFNVPFNKMKGVLNLFDEENLHQASKQLAASTIVKMSYLDVEDIAKSGDFIYFDPPYVPLSETANFTSYQSTGFNEKDQLQLLELAVRLKNRGMNVVLSNSSADWVLSHYSKAGFEVNLINARRNIGGKGATRDSVMEAVIV